MTTQPRQSETMRGAVALLRRSEHVLFGVLLIIGTAQAWTDERLRVVVAPLALLMAGWYVVGVVLARRAAGPRAALGWLLGLTACWLALMVASPSYVWLAFPLYLLYLQLLPSPWAVLGVAGLAAASIAALVAQRGRVEPGVVVGPVIGAAVALVITVVYRSLRREAEVRAELLRELTEAQERLAATERRAGVLAERERLAHEIHDTVGQDLSGIILLLRAAKEGSADPRLAVAEQAAQDALEGTRRLVRALTPAELAGRSLPEALDRLVGDAGHYGVDVRLVLDGEPYPLATPAAVALLRIAQAALANVRAHAAAGKAAVTLTYQPSAVRLDVADDGVGFDTARPVAAPTSGTGLGLAAMRARLAEVGGALEVESAPGHGTAISATVPL